MSLDYEIASQAFAFLGNSLLAPMSQTSPAGLLPEFWEEFPDFDNKKVGDAIEGCLEFAREAHRREGAGENMVERVSVEYTRLFMGPPRPAAAPWETAYRGAQGADGFVGFGEATVAMRRTLANLGLEVRNQNNQYADHMGIELLCLSAMLGRVEGGDCEAADILDFISERPLSWCDDFAAKVSGAMPGGYFSSLVNLVSAMLHMFEEELGEDFRD